MAYADILKILETTQAVKLLPYSIFIKNEGGLEKVYVTLPKKFPTNFNDPLYKKLDAEPIGGLKGLVHLYSLSRAIHIDDRNPFYDLENESTEDLEALEKIKETYVSLALAFASKTDEPTFKTSMEKGEYLVGELKKVAEELGE
jgi:hypothetical protein